MTLAIHDIVSDLNGLTTEDEFTRKCEGVFASLGFNKFTYVGFDVETAKDLTSPPPDTDVIYLTNLDPAWVQRYVEKEYAVSDPTFRDCYTSRLPFRWTEKYRANSRSVTESQMMEDAWENGVKRGLTVPVHGPDGELGILSLNSDLDDSEFMKVTDQSQYDVHLIANYVHNAIQTKFQRDPVIPMPTPLTNREVEILQWTVGGKTAWEIGSILSISERTVNFHIQNVMEKFGVHNKTQAAAKAVGMGLLEF